MYDLHLSGFYVRMCSNKLYKLLEGILFIFCFIQTFTGGHTLSGACIEPRSLEELFPNWREMGVCTSINMRIKKSHKGTYFFHMNFYIFL